jgi:UDP-N-acetylglucosamine 3-dehydrogenase
MKKIRVAYLGAGEISDRFIVMAKKLKDVENAAICSRNIRNANTKSKKYGIPEYYNNYKKMLREIKPDAVVVTTTHPLHAKHAIDCMKAGAHVLVEKPIATSFADGKKMYNASKKYKKIMNGLPFDHYPHYTRALDFVKEKYIGKILSAHSELSVQGPPRNNWYYVKKYAKGGALIDVGCYALSRVISIMGPVKRVTAMVDMIIPKRLLPNGDKITPSVDDQAIMILDFGNGVYSTVKASWAHTHYENYTAIYGRHGAVYINADNRQLIVKSDLKKAGKKTEFRGMGNCYEPGKFPKFGPDDDILGKFIEAIRSDKQPVYDAAQSLHIMEVMDRAYLSAKTGKTQKITTGFKMWWPKEKSIQNLKNTYI